MEELELDTNNLCTTEDAFEQFQSGAMYEDEYITLSDIVSSPLTNQDANENMHDDPCDDVSLSMQDEKTENKMNIPPKQSSEFLDVNSQRQGKRNKEKTRTSKRRGRKKKGSFQCNIVHESQCPIDLNETKPKIQNRKSFITSDTGSNLKFVEECVSEEPKDAILVTDKVKPANKAKKKSYNLEKEIKKQVKNKPNQKKSLNEDKNIQIINSTIKGSNIRITTSTSDIKKSKRKRGKRKHNTSSQNPILNDTKISAKCEIKSVVPPKNENNELETSIPVMASYNESNKSSVKDTSNFENKQTLKDSLVSEFSENYMMEEEIEDLPLSSLSRKSENNSNKNVVLNTTLENKNLTGLNINPKNTISNGKEIKIKKRGRPKNKPVHNFSIDNSPAKADLEIKKTTSGSTEKCQNISDVNNTQERHNKFDNQGIISEPVITSESQVSEACEKINISTESNTQSKRNSKKKIIPDYEYNVDSLVKNNKLEDTQKSHEEFENLGTEDSSRRPVRQRVLRNWNYDEGSDEDPYANMESSDDEPRRRKKGGKYYSDDEYFPGDKRQLTESESDIAMEDDIDVDNRPQKKKRSKRLDLATSKKSPRKKIRKSDAESICTTEKTNTNTDSGDVDFDDCLDSTTIRRKDEQVTPTKSNRGSQQWGKVNEFENFIAKIVQGTDIKISKKSVDNVKTSLQIPVIEATEAKKNIEKSVQTVNVNTKPACVQTDTVYEIPMKDQVPLTGEQAEKACDFLSSIVQTTAELGQLMTQKSEDFIAKKINTKYVTDTFKMDYCVKKSFLLFKLAKHNLVQMEEDLSKQYEEFLKENNLIQHRQEQKIIASTSKASDSDCEIVEEPDKNKCSSKANKPAFNPKTVFLNKELSIKIAKKATEESTPKKKINIKGRHSVWINDSVVVKKVKPNHSFLAQDSRNKKPPDNKITLKQVNDFFKMYEHQKALIICAPFVRTQWFSRERKYICNYFIHSTTDFSEKTVVLQNENDVPEETLAKPDSIQVNIIAKPGKSILFSPETLSLLCTKIVQNCLQTKQSYPDKISKQNDVFQYEQLKTCSNILKKHAIEKTHLFLSDINKNIVCYKPNCNVSICIQPLKTLCFKRVKEQMNSAHINDGKSKLTSNKVNAYVTAFYEKNNEDINNIMKSKKNTSSIKKINPLPSLITLCIKALQETQKGHLSQDVNNITHMPKFYNSISHLKMQSVVNGKCISNITNSEQHFYNVQTLLQLCINSMNISFYRNNIKNTTSVEEKLYNVKPLLQLCINSTNISLYKNNLKNSTSVKQKLYDVKTLLQLCINLTNISLYRNSIKNTTGIEEKLYNVKPVLQLCINLTNISLYRNSTKNTTKVEERLYNVKPLLQLCINATNISLFFNKAINKIGGTMLWEQKNPQIHSVMTLNSICRKKISEFNSEWYTRQYMCHEKQSDKTALNFCINNVNSISNDLFFEAASEDDPGELDNDNYNQSPFQNEDEQHNYSNVCGINFDEICDNDNNWVSQVKMQGLRSCLDPTYNSEIKNKISGNNENLSEDSIIHIKIEPNEYQLEIEDSSNIKTEPVDDHENTGEINNYSSINIITKQEDIIETQVGKEPIRRQSSNSYDEQRFEDFVSSNKMITSCNVNDCERTSNEIFSQSSQRVRRQYEPDYEDDINVLTDTMNLLVPQNVESKKRLLESSQEEDDDEDCKKSNKKKSEKHRGKVKKDIKHLANKGKILQKNEITVLTKKMKDKIRQEQKKIESSDSEQDCLKLDKEKTTENKSNNKSDIKQKEDEEKVIQCNDVDSTEFITEKKFIPTLPNNKNDEELDEDSFENHPDEISPSSLIDSNEQVEVLDCEPLLPIFDALVNKESKDKIYEVKIDNSDVTSYVGRHGWKCYPIDRKDGKIYAHAHVQLDKLPESFLDTYFKYQDMTDRTTEDVEIDKLTNISSLQRTRPKEEIRNNFIKNKPKIIEEETKVKPDICDVIEPNVKPLKKEILNEISPSGDETTSKIEEYIAPAPMQNSENNFAKNLLINDVSDTEKIDAEKETQIKIENMEESTYKTRSGRTIKRKNERAQLQKDDLMLTADKVMNKELTLLHAPVNLKKEEDDDVKSPTNKSLNTKKNTSKDFTTRIRIRTEDDDSSSEEEKQWFTTKEKLLKRLLKKNESAHVDDAKRAKIVSEFIEKRGELPEPRHRARSRPRCSKKTIMERRKQIKILSRELFGVDTGYTKKYSQANTSKGRRNIRKVIEKKSLACSTVRANMEEFERKRRLTIRQSQLREVLGCEEGVNVVVINDELCLEYDFEEKRPIVSVHPFFTKVMKAHQYEGVKFMWDACFESVSLTSGGGSGGGCILAHCMGLGKTLQVLALLHTVLTHPQVGMRRVLVCCPLSTVLNWVDEIHKWIGPVTNSIKVFELSKLKKTYERAYQLEDWYNGGGIFIIGYELFRSLSTLDPVLDCIRPTIVNKIRTALLDPGPDIIVCDEGHLLKNDCSVLAVAMSRVVTKRRIILTGTPMQNNLREYYCMVNFVKPNLLGSYSEYSNRFENPIMNGQHRDSREEDIKLMKARTHILHKVLEGCLQRQEASVLYPYLPKKHEYTVFISLTKCQWELYKHYLTHYINTKENKQSVLRDFHVLQKIWTHPLVLNNFLTKTRDDEKESKIKVEKLEDELEEGEQAVRSAAAWWADTDHRDVLDQLDSSYKFLVVFRLLHECVELGDKVLIFSTSLYAMDALEFFLNRENKWTLGREYYRLDGSVPAEVRQKWCREFNAPQNTSTKLFLISTRAGSLGLNMTAANRVIILDTSWNPAHDIQSIFRVYRFGQKKDCYIYRLVAMGTMEQKIYERSVTKQAVSCRVVDEQQIDRHYNMAELSELYRLDEVGSGVSAGLAADVRDEALLRVAAAAAAAGGGGLHAVHEHDSLLRGSSESVLPEHERNAAWIQFQQEHATTHIPNFEMDIPKRSVEDTIVQPNANIIELKKEQESESYMTDTTSTTKKGKKPKKKLKKKKNKPEPKPSISQQKLDPDVEENMIKKIMNILIKHNVHTAKSPEEISALAKNVQNVVSYTKASKRAPKKIDPLTASIARVVLEGDNISKQNDKDDINKIESDGDTDSMEINLQGRKRRGNRIDSDEEYVPETRKRKTTAKTSSTRRNNESVNSDNNCVGLNSDSESTKNFATEEVLDKNPAIVNSKKSETLNEISSETDERVKLDVIACKESERKVKTSDEVILKENHSSSFYETMENESSNECIEINDNFESDTITNDSPVQTIENESICLSDDDEPLIIAPVPQNELKINIVDDMKEGDIIPLHKSLLTNKNFIKLVAHTYLSGNPMLDEDAAVLAAQYSTLKALKEIQATGKNLTSGPIHDIAVKVLGIDLMKRLYVANPNKNTKETKLIGTKNVEKETPIDTFLENLKQVEEIQESIVTKINKKTEPEIKTKNTIKRKMNVLDKVNEAKKDIEIASQSTNKSSQESVSSETSNPKVVPVGIFKGPVAPSSQELSFEECILPDDDEVIISAPPPTTSTRPRHSPLARRNSKQLIVNTVSSKESSGRESSRAYVEELVPKATISVSSRPPARSTTDNIKPVKASLPITNENTSRNNVQTVQNVTKSDVNTTINIEKTTVPATDMTICLDSDEEDNPSVVEDEMITKPTTTSDSRTLIVSPLVKNTVTKNSVVNDNKKTMVPVTSVNTPSSTSKNIDTTKTRPDSIDLRQKRTKEKRSIKVTETKCKPGDIIRINESGKVEILKRVTGAELAASQQIIKLKDDNRSQNNVKLTFPTGNYQSSKEKVVKKVLDKPNFMKEDKRNEVPSTTSMQQNDSDPLLVLKDVVHIPAFKYDKTVAPKPPIEKSPPTPSSSAKEVTVNTKMQNAKLTEVKPIISFKSTPQIKSNDDKQTIVKKKIIATKSISATTNEVLKPKLDACEEFVIDLTSSQQDQVKKAGVSSRANEALVVASSSKDKGTNKVTSVTNDLKKSTIVNVRNSMVNSSLKLSTTSRTVPSTSDSKRPSPWSEGAQSKKIKTYTIKNMTLQDFNIDDIDDIIELE